MADPGKGQALERWSNALGYAGNASTQFGNAMSAPQYRQPMPYDPQSMMRQRFMQMQMDKAAREEAQEKGQQAALAQFTTPQTMGMGYDATGSGDVSPAQRAGLPQAYIDLMRTSPRGGELAMQFMAEQAKRNDYVPTSRIINGVEVAGQMDRKTGEFKPWSQDFPLSKEVEDQKSRLARAGATTVNQTVANDTSGALAGGLKDIAKEGQTAGRVAVNMIQTGNRIQQAIDEGGVPLGPGATFRHFGKQLAHTLGIGGKDTEQSLANTRSVIKDLASATLDARQKLKGQGSVSDFEGKALEKATSGNIDDLTEPELRAVVEANNRLAGIMYGEYEQGIKAMEADDIGKRFAPFYRAPKMPEAYKPKGAKAAPTVTPDQAREELRRRGVIK